MARFMKRSFDTAFDMHIGRENWELIEIPSNRTVSEVTWAREYALSHKGHFMLQDTWNGRVIFEMKQ